MEVHLAIQASLQALHLNNSNKLNMIRIPTGGRQTSWLFTRMTEELNQGLPRTTPASGQSGIWTRGHRIEIQRPNHSAILPPKLHFFRNVPRLCDISQENSRVSRLSAKSPDSRKNVVFLLKHALLELSSPPTPHEVFYDGFWTLRLFKKKTTFSCRIFGCGHLGNSLPIVYGSKNN